MYVFKHFVTIAGKRAVDTEGYVAQIREALAKDNKGFSTSNQTDPRENNINNSSINNAVEDEELKSEHGTGNSDQYSCEEEKTDSEGSGSNTKSDLEADVEEEKQKVNRGV